MEPPNFSSSSEEKSSSDTTGEKSSSGSTNTKDNTESSHSQELIESRNIVTNFGTLEVCKERTKIITCSRPQTTDKITYTINRNKHLKLIKENFELDHTKGTLNPTDELKLAITYKPTLPSNKDEEIFQYVDSLYEIIRITVSGRAVGPHCQISTKRIVLYKTPEKKVTEGKFEITNNSLATAYFKIEHIEADVFEICPLEGIINPKSYQLIGVKFCPNKPGFFMRKMFCLLLHSEPYVVDLLGYYDNHFEDVEDGLKYYNFHADLTYGFGAYFNDCLSIRSDVPPFSLSSNYMDFGSVLMGGKEPKTQVTSLTNHMKKSIWVEWQEGSRIFTIRPTTIEILPMVSAQFEVEFNPDDGYNTYCETIIAQIFWKIQSQYIKETETNQDEPRRTAPLTCTLKLQGHSFPVNEGWITHIEVIPEVVYWQPCLPGQTVSATFLLQNKSHLPVMYKLIPPKKSNIIAKPMIGKFRNFEIVAVHLQTEKEKVKSYIEEWKIVINDREDKIILLYLHGETNIPTIEVGTENKIDCGNIQEGSRKQISVLVKNKSYFSIKYKFQLKKRTIIDIDPIEGVLRGNEETKVMFTVTGVKCAPNVETFECETFLIDNKGAVSGDVFETPVELYTECSYAELCACPSEEHFGKQPFGKKISAEFEAVNFGESPIYFQACQCGEHQHDKNFRIKPCFGEIQPGDTKEFHISGIISLSGPTTLQFGYYNRVTKDSPMVTGAPVIFFSLTYCSEFPTIQIDEIVEHNFGPMFGKNHLFWDYLKVPRFNKILREIVSDQTKEISLRLPEFELGDKQFTISLALVNSTTYKTTVELKRKKLCDCSLVEKGDTGLTKRKKDFNCPHRDMFSMELGNTTFEGHSVQYLTIDIKYSILNNTKMCYIMSLSNYRVIKIYVEIFSIPPDIPRLSLYTDKFEMILQNIFIGTREAPVQMFWMYNNTNKLLNIEFDTREIHRLCSLEGFTVLELLNPIDQILPYKSHALYIKFLPIELKTYRLEINASFYNPGKTPNLLNFVIEGTGDSEKGQRSTAECLKRVSKYNRLFPITLSTECIEVDCLLIWNKSKHLIFMKNNSKKVIQYVWETIKIENVVEVSVDKPYGLLEAKTVQPVVLIVKSFSQSCFATLLLPCEVINYTDLILHRKTKESYDEIQKKIDDEFTYGEGNKLEQPENPITILPKPETLYTNIVLNINIYHTKDLDQNLDPTLQFEQYPSQSVENIRKSLLKKYYPENIRRRTVTFPEKPNVGPSLGVNERFLFCDILEGAIGEVIYSNGFKEYLKKASEAPLHYYTEFVMDDRKIMLKKRTESPLSAEDIMNFRKRQIEIFFEQPKATDISNILQNLIYDSVLKIAQCVNPKINIKELTESLENTLYRCNKKNCACNKK